MEGQNSGAAGKDWSSGYKEAGEEELEKAQEIEAVDKLGMLSSPDMFSQGEEEGDQPTDLVSNELVAEEELEECFNDGETKGKEVQIDEEEREMDHKSEEKENGEEQDKSEEGEEDEKSEVEEVESEEDESSGDLVSFSNPLVKEKKVQEVEEQEAGMSASPELFSQGGEGRDQDQLAGLFSDEPEAEEDEDGDDWIDL